MEPKNQCKVALEPAARSFHSADSKGHVKPRPTPGGYDDTDTHHRPLSPDLGSTSVTLRPRSRGRTAPWQGPRRVLGPGSRSPPAASESKSVSLKPTLPVASAAVSASVPAGARLKPPMAARAPPTWQALRTAPAAQGDAAAGARWKTLWIHRTALRRDRIG